MSDQRRASENSRPLTMLMALAVWMIALGVVAMLFGQYLDHREHPNRHAAGQVSESGVRDIVLRANASGHYIAEGRINGQAVTFMLDTGASDVSIPASLAERLALEPGREVRYQTANGMVTGYATTLARVSLGPIEQLDVRGSINPRMDGDRVLLGMSFLGDLAFSQRDGELTVTQFP